MSFNRRTQAYRKRVKSLASAIRWTLPKLGDHGRYYTPGIDEVFADHEPGAPRYLLDDAVALALRDEARSIETSDRFTQQCREKLADLQERVAVLRRPKLRLVEGAL